MDKWECQSNLRESSYIIVNWKHTDIGIKIILFENCSTILMMVSYNDF
jgi:hypothetical protein